MKRRGCWTPGRHAIRSVIVVVLGSTGAIAKGQELPRSAPGPATQVSATRPPAARSARPASRPIEQGAVSVPGAAPVAPAKPNQGFRLKAAYDGGFVLRTPDRATELKIGASAQLDSRFYAGDSVAPNSFDIRRARIDFQAKLFERLAIRIQAALEDGTPYIRNAFGDLRLWSFLHLRGGQMKVPFSSSWLAMDNQVDFLERSTGEPLYPFFDRGFMVWGNLIRDRITYVLGVYTGVGVDVDSPKGDNDSNKDIAWRLFLQPFRSTPLTFLEGLYLVGDGTWGFGNVPSRRFETRGLVAADFESLVWRWRGAQVLGTNARNTDQLSAEYDSRTRWGAELHYLRGPFTFSAEWAHVRYQGLRLFHDFLQGSKRLKHDFLFERNGGAHNLTAFVSYFLTGESKYLDAFGWKQPKPLRPLFAGGENGPGAFELLARFSATLTDRNLFDSRTVNGFAPADFTDPTLKLQGPAVAEGAAVTAALLEGAPTLYEMTLGLNWTMNAHLRLQLDYVLLYAADFAAGKNGILSGANSDLYDATLKAKQVQSEHEVGLRLILRI